MAEPGRVDPSSTGKQTLCAFTTELCASFTPWSLSLSFTCYVLVASLVGDQRSRTHIRTGARLCKGSHTAVRHLSSLSHLLPLLSLFYKCHFIWHIPTYVFRGIFSNQTGWNGAEWGLSGLTSTLNPSFTSYCVTLSKLLLCASVSLSLNGDGSIPLTEGY